MAATPETIARLLQKTEALQKAQAELESELRHLRQELLALQGKAASETLPLVEAPTAAAPMEETIAPPVATPPLPLETEAALVIPPPVIPPIPKPAKPRRDHSAWEKFLGENLINKIGIAVLVIGVAIGAKYSIEHNLISPLTRIMLGYLTGIGLFIVGFRLKAKYEAFSAVLVSGAIAIMYFITYAAYGFYALLPQGAAFALMVLFTGFIVTAAVHYNRQVVALIGLVGAYAVPFLLSEGSGQVAVLLSYVFIINIGILVLAFKRMWKALYYTAFALTWVIFASWFAIQYRAEAHFGLAFTFLTLFFAQFYTIFLVYKLARQEALEIADVALLLFNAFVFYGLGYALLADRETGAQLLGLFTLGNALLHFGVAVLLRRQPEEERKRLFYLVAALVLTFVTIAAPVQLNGHWVTLLWTAEAAALFWIGRTRGIALYEMLSYPLMVLAFGSLLQDWDMAYNTYYLMDETVAKKALLPIFNIHFATSALFLAAFAGIYKLYRNPQYPSTVLAERPKFRKIADVALPVVLLLVSFYAFQLEIAAYFDARYTASAIQTGGDDPQTYHNIRIEYLKTVWLVNYLLLYASALAWLNLRKIQNLMLGWVNMGLLLLGILGFLTNGLTTLSVLRNSYLYPDSPLYFKTSAAALGLRYVSYVFVAAALWALSRYVRTMFNAPKFRMGFDALLHLSLLWIVSSELINVLELGGNRESDRLGLSILWGLYALLLIVLGIRQRKQYLRFGAMGLFGITLLKLFFYDIAELGTIAKTVVFVSLGILLLVISFLYNKYTSQIFHEEPEEK